MINESFPDEQLFGVQEEEPWFADIVNYLVSNIMPPDLSYAQRKKFLHESGICGMSHFFFDKELTKSSGDVFLTSKRGGS